MTALELLPLLVVAWCGHTPESAAIAEDLELALTDCGLLQKQAAIDMGLTPEKFSKQLAGVEPLNLLRLGYLPAAFHVAFAKRRIRRFGGVGFDHSEREFVLHAVKAGPKAMARVSPDLFQKERAS